MICLSYSSGVTSPPSMTLHENVRRENPQPASQEQGPERKAEDIDTADLAEKGAQTLAAAGDNGNPSWRGWDSMDRPAITDCAGQCWNCM